ncbi:MAG: hypothetical protein ACE5H4_16380 [Candidatus Thorarchaeota archaeon]
MREYNSSIGKTVLVPVVLAVIVVAGFAATIFWPPGGNGTTTTTTTTTTNGGGQGYGPLAATYLNSRRDDVVFFWMCNSTFVNVDLSDFYDQQHAGAFVDGVKMVRNDTDNYVIEVLFSPWDPDNIGRAYVPPSEWFAVSGSLIDDGIAQMADATSYPTDWPQTWPIDFYVHVFFEDLTFFYMGFTPSDNFVYICNGTWTGEYTPNGWPVTSSYNDGYWLLEDGLLQTPISQFFSIITNNVVYPE